MSIFLEAKLVCTNCGTENGVDLAASVNADLRPDLRDAILNGSFQAIACEKCGTALRIPAHLTYIDIGRGQWTLVESFASMPTWKEAEEAAKSSYDLCFGSKASDAAREIGEGLTPRLTFGWPALREKLVCADLGLQDTELELLKMSIIANVAQPPASDQTELRLTGGNAEKLNFAWIVSGSEQAVATLEVPRDAYDDVVEDADDWAPLRAEFDGNLFVDMKRLVSGSGLSA
jgi:CpXC protein